MQETDKFWTNLIEITPGVSLKEGLNLMVSQSGMFPALNIFFFPLHLHWTLPPISALTLLYKLMSLIMLKMKIISIYKVMRL